MNSKDNLLKTIEKSGWHLNIESIEEFLVSKQNLSATDLIKKALDYDLRNIGAKHLPDLIVSGKAESFEGANCVVQLVKLRNIAAPKDNENCMTAPPMYRVTFSDGNSNCNGLVLDNINKLNLDTPPGTKFLLTGNIKIKSNLLILNNSNCKNLGGHVEYLVTKWKTNKELSQHVRAINMTEKAPPPWVPFGAKQTNQVDTSKKVLSQNEKPEEDESSEFSQARQAALAEALEAKSKVTKTFTQQTIDKSQIEKAASTSATFSARPSSALPSTTLPNTKPKTRKNRNKDSDEEDYKEAKDAAKPSAVTLFDLFKTKLDIKDDTDNQNIHSSASNYENNQREQAHRGGRRGGRGGSRGGNRGNVHQQNMTSSASSQIKNEKNQVYNQDDFAYDLGDKTNVKDIAAIKSFEKKNQDEKQPNNFSNASNNNINQTLNNEKKYNDFNKNTNNRNNNSNNSNNSNNNFNPRSNNRNYDNNRQFNNNFDRPRNDNNPNFQNYNSQMPPQIIQPVTHTQPQYNNTYQSYPNNDFYQMQPPNPHFYNQSQNFENRNFRPRGRNNNNNNYYSSGNNQRQHQQY